VTDTTTDLQASPVPAGLEVLRSPGGRNGWYVRHVASGLPATQNLRLKRHAVAAMDSLYRSGADFAQASDGLRHDPAWPEVVKLGRLWRRRSQMCCEAGDGEHYSPYTWRGDGRRCHGGGPGFQMFEAS
jgi:hypothetical protein